MFRRWQNLGEILPDWLEFFIDGFNDRPALLREVEEFAKREKVPILLPSAASFLRFLSSVLRPEKVLEIGTGIGYSTLSILMGYPPAKVITVDSNRKRAEVADSFFRKGGFEVDLIVSDGLDLMRSLICREEEFDLVFVDAVKSEYPFYNFKVQSLLSERGVAVFDNVLFRGYVAGRPFNSRYTRTVRLLKLFLESVKEYPGFSSTILPVGDGLLLLYRLV